MEYAWILFGAGAYLMGAIPFGKGIARVVARVDITQRGSGNIGATNVARELGIKWGIVTLVLDILKGLAPLLVLMRWAPPPSDAAPQTALALVGLCALLGHQFSVFMKFKGGKGVATALGVYLAISPTACLAGLAVFLFTVAKWDYISLGSILSSFTVPLVILLMDKPSGVFTAALAMALLITVQHRENIRRLIKGQERKWKKRSDQPSRSSSRSNSSSL